MYTPFAFALLLSTAACAGATQNETVVTVEIHAEALTCDNIAFVAEGIRTKRLTGREERVDALRDMYMLANSRRCSAEVAGLAARTVVDHMAELRAR